MSFEALLQKTDTVVADKLGGPVVYRSGDGTEKATTGIFDAAWLLVDPQQTGVSSSGPACFIHDTLPGDPKADTNAHIIVNGAEYRVHTTKPDGLGGFLFVLHEVS